MAPNSKDIRWNMMASFFIVENVIARVCKETGEQFFASETVEQIQSIIKSRKGPDRVIQTPVYYYA
jgi:hypothetical protein